MLKSFIRIVLGISFGVVVLNLYSSCTSVQRIQDTISPSTLKAPDSTDYSSIIRLNNKNLSFFCSGVVISRDFALTAAHCVVDSFDLLKKEDIIITSEDDYYTGTVAKVMSLDNDRDVALIKGDFSRFASTPVDWTGQYSWLIQSQTALSSCGFPSGEALLCVTIWYSGNSNFKYVFRGGPIYKGMSGGPVLAVFKDGSYIVVGINSAVFDGGLIIGPVIGSKSILWGL